MNKKSERFKNYSLNHKHDYNMIIKNKSKIIERIKNNININNKTGCWEWKLRRDKDGYASINLGGNRERCSRISYQIYKGQIPNKMLVCHTCDNPPCVNPDHLFIGTHKDNMDDMVSKGKNKKGTNNGRHKLNNNMIKEIKKLYPIKSMPTLAKMYNVSVVNISSIIRGKIWKHVS
jgi:hypothetical protein